MHKARENGLRVVEERVPYTIHHTIHHAPYTIHHTPYTMRHTNLYLLHASLQVSRAMVCGPHDPHAIDRTELRRGRIQSTRFALRPRLHPPDPNPYSLNHNTPYTLQDGVEERVRAIDALRLAAETLAAEQAETVEELRRELQVFLSPCSSHPSSYTYTLHPTGAAGG